MDLTSGIEKMSVGHPPVGHPPVGHLPVGHPAEGRGAPCQTCQDICSGFQPHSWRKACMACHCSLEDHAPSSDLEDDHRMGRLLADSKYAHLTAKVKGGAGLRVYKRNRMIITNPVVSRKDPTFNTITYDWAPPGLTQKLAMQYMELLPEEKRPVAGTEGALYRRRQLLRQLPVYDHDPAACQGLSEQGARDMAAFIRSYKDEALGVGEVALPGEGGASREGGGAGRDGATKQKNGKGGQDHPDPPSSTISNGIKDSCKTREYFCSGCGEEVPSDSPVVYAERAGYEQQWHPTCFRCSQCSEALVDLVYFWKSGTLLCGRHYCQSSHSRCAGCDQLLFSEERHTSPDGQTWHKEHFCCWRCGQSLEEPCSCPH